MTFLVQIVIYVVASLLAAALQPKPKGPEPVKVRTPVVDEGQKVRKVYGTCWIEDPMVLAFKTMGTTKIKAKGKK